MTVYIHALREEGDPAQCAAGRMLAEISIHALREEGDAPQDNPPRQQSIFLSTPSARRATLC